MSANSGRGACKYSGLERYARVAVGGSTYYQGSLSESRGNKFEFSDEIQREIPSQAIVNSIILSSRAIQSFLLVGQFNNSLQPRCGIINIEKQI